MPGGQLQTNPFGTNWFWKQVPPSWHGFGLHRLKACSHLCPIKPIGHMQMYLLNDPASGKQLPPLKHGLLLQTVFINCLASLASAPFKTENRLLLK